MSAKLASRFNKKGNNLHCPHCGLAADGSLPSFFWILGSGAGSVSISSRRYQVRTQRSLLKKTALGLTLIYLFLSVSMTISVERHLSEHGRHADHGHRAQHTSLDCAWMCAAADSIHPDDQKRGPASNLSPESLPINVEQISSYLFRSSNPIRPPPSL